MQSGFSMLKEPDKPNEEMLHYLNTLLVVFAEKSIHFGVHYAKCAGRTNLSGTDTLYALQYLSHEFLNLPDLNERVQEHEQDDIEDNDTDDSDSADNDSDSADEFTRAPDDDPICAKMNQYHDTWDAWEPSDDVQILLKRNVDKTMSKLG